MVDTIRRRPAGHPLRDPSDVCDQSFASTSAAISPTAAISGVAWSSGWLDEVPGKLLSRLDIRARIARMKDHNPLRPDLVPHFHRPPSSLLSATFRDRLRALSG